MSRNGKSIKFQEQEILNRVFTGTSLLAVSTSSPTASATAGGSLDNDYSIQEVWNGAFDATNNLLNLV